MNQNQKLKFEIFLTWIALAFLLVSATMGFTDAGKVFMEKFQAGTALATWKQTIFITLVASLFYGGLIYQACRLAYLYRKKNDVTVTDAEVDWLFKETAPSVVVMVPSYKEEDQVNLQTLFSACFQDYPNKSVVLLIDNPPNPDDEIERIELEQARRLPVKLNHLFGEIFQEIQKEWKAYGQRQEAGIKTNEFYHLAQIHRKCASWTRARANEYKFTNHTDKFFTDKIIIATIQEFEAKAREIESTKAHLVNATEYIELGYNRLMGRFRVHVSSFERKRYLNLSHESNKAMNLNSYISVLGKSFYEVKTSDGFYLEPFSKEKTNHTQVLSFDEARYCVTLDADSILLPGYITKLVHMMELPGNEKMAVVQTPYSAFPRSPGNLEKIAGATTDIQYIIHQGFTFFNATFWVGANAILRHTALLDIAEEIEERDYKVMRYIHDHTPIEDTESTIDLVAKGWSLYNHPERLAYSATPPDFGSLLIQRRRWANGGLLIFPKLFKNIINFRLFLKNPIMHVAESLVRSHYLLSIAMVNFGLLIMLGFSFEDCTNSAWLPLTALPYYLLYARDLRLNGYKYSDLLQVYAINLVMIPVNLGGVIKSMHQAVTGVQTPFARTPKVVGRTSAPWAYHLCELALVISWTTAAIAGMMKGHYTTSSFALAHALILIYGIHKFIGFEAMREDVVKGLEISFKKKPIMVAEHTPDNVLAFISPKKSEQEKEAA